MTELPVSLEPGRDKICYCQDHRASQSFDHREFLPEAPHSLCKQAHGRVCYLLTDMPRHT